MKPRLRDFMICDYVITEAGTGKKSLIGKFDSISSGRFPCRRQFHVYFAIVEAYRNFSLSLEIIAMETGESIAHAEFPHAFPKKDPRMPTEILLQMTVSFPREGTYDFRVICDAELLDSRPLYLRRLSPGGKPPPGKRP